MLRKQLSRRDFLSRSAAVAAGVVLSACAPKVEQPAPTSAPVEATNVPTTPVPQATAQAEKAVITFWVEPPTDERRKVISEVFRDTFNAAHPDVNLEITFTEDIMRVLRTAMQAGSGPDIVSSYVIHCLEYVRAGHLAPLDDFAARYGWKDEMLPWAYESGFIKGHLYSVPLTFESMIVFYNKTLFDSKGWKPPTNRAEMEAIIDACVKDDIYPFSYNNAEWKPSTEHLIGMFYDHYAGADNIYKALIGEKKWTDQEFVGAMALMNEWFQKGYYSGSIDNYHGFTSEDVWNNLATGKAAMMMTGTWAFQAPADFFEESGQEWDWFPMVPLREGVKPVYALATGQTESINAKCQHLDAAGEVMDWLYNDKKRALKIASAFNFGEWVLPLRYEAADFPEGTDPRVVRYFADFVEVTGRGDYGYTTWTFWPAKTNVYLWEEYDRVLTGELTPAEFQAGAQKLFEEEFAAEMVPPVPKRG